MFNKICVKHKYNYAVSTLINKQQNNRWTTVAILNIYFYAEIKQVLKAYILGFNFKILVRLLVLLWSVLEAVSENTKKIGAWCQKWRRKKCKS